MPGITALIHTHNDALRIGRALEMLLPCDEILIVDHGSTDETLRLVRAYGARIVQAEASSDGSQYAAFAANDWILCLLPNESITERLQISLYEGEFAASPASISSGVSIPVREETAQGWLDLSAYETRLVPRTWTRWNDRLPTNEASSQALEGELLRFSLP